jgi:hypothetical protein
MAAISGAGIGKDICEVLGLDARKVHTIEIKVVPDEAVIVTVKQYVQLEEFKKLNEILTKYELVPKTEDQNNGMNLTEYRNYPKGGE